MKRNMELVRLLLLDIEGADKPDLSKYSENEQTYHRALIIEAELTHGGVVEDEKGFPAAAVGTRLTWKGHEFLDAARNETIWGKAISKLKAAGMSIPLPLLQELLTSFLKKQIGLEYEAEQR
jgi:hypothetical protein